MTIRLSWVHCHIKPFGQCRNTKKSQYWEFGLWSSSIKHVNSDSRDWTGCLFISMIYFIWMLLVMFLFMRHKLKYSLSPYPLPSTNTNTNPLPPLSPTAPPQHSSQLPHPGPRWAVTAAITCLPLCELPNVWNVRMPILPLAFQWLRSSFEAWSNAGCSSVMLFTGDIPEDVSAVLALRWVKDQDPEPLYSGSV